MIVLHVVHNAKNLLVGACVCVHDQIVLHSLLLRELENRVVGNHVLDVVCIYMVIFCFG